MTPVEELRAAAAKLREMRAAALEEMRINPYWHGDPANFALGINDACGGAAGELAAMFSPPAAEHLAALLVSIANEAERHEAKGWGNSADEVINDHALALARDLNQAEEARSE